MDAERLVCTYPQYYGCRVHKQCRLYHICSQLKTKKIAPNGYQYYQFKVYRKFNAIPLSKAERTEHNLKLAYYNYLWGNHKEYAHNYYIEHREEILSSRRKKTYKEKVFKVQEGYCDFDCKHCKYNDCVLPSWNNYNEYMKLYKAQNHTKISLANKQYYEANKEQILAKQKIHRTKPEVKKARAEYDKYYRETHREQCREKTKRYYEKHKDEINAKKREKRLQQKLEKEKNK